MVGVARELIFHTFPGIPGWEYLTRQSHYNKGPQSIYIYILMLITVCAHNIVKIKQTIVLLDMTISYNVVLSSTTILFTPNHLTTMVKLSYVIHNIFTNLGSMVYCDDPTMLQKFESLATSWLWTFNLWTGKMQIWILIDYSAAPRGHLCGTGDVTVSFKFQASAWNG